MATTIQSNASDSALLINGTEALPFNLGGAPRTLESLTCTQASGALTFTVNPTIMQMRSSTLTSGVPQTVKLNTAVSLVLPSLGTLGFPTTVPGRIIVVLMANGEPAIVSIAGGNSLDETGLINTTAISASSTANNVFYSTTARTNQPYRVVGAVDVVNTAGAWGNPTLVQPYGGQALAAMSSIGYGQTRQNLTASRSVTTTYYNTTGKPIKIFVSVLTTSSGYASMLIGGVSQNGTFSGGAGNPSNFSEIVLPGESYSLENALISSYAWFEVR